jgi:CHAT domain-containing protein
MFVWVGASRRFRVSIALVVLSLAMQQPAAVRRTSPLDSFERAKQLSWLNNWAEASKVLGRLERSGRLELDERNRTLARAVEIRGNIESLSLPTAARELDRLLATKAAGDDQSLRLQILAMKGDVEFQYDLATAEKTWREVELLSAEIGNRGWEARAGGELGCIAFLNGQAFTALKKVSASLIRAEAYNDVAERMKRLTALGEGLAEFGRPADALAFFNRALALSSEQPDAYFPFTAYLGKARLLLERGSHEGRSMLMKGLADAQRQNQRVRESRILIVLGDDAVRVSNTDDAVKWFSTAVEVARSTGLGRIEAEAGSKLASVLVQRGELDEAAERARDSVAAAEKSGDLYHLPLDLAALAEIEVSRGDFGAAGSAYDKATQLVRSLFEDLPNARHESTVVATMGRVFQDYFAFALDTLHNPNKAFEILESARARGLVDRIRLSQAAGQTETETRDPAMMRLVAILNRRLAGEQNSGYRQRLLDELWETELRALRFGDAPRELEFISAKPAVTLYELQHRLNDEDVLIEYALGPSRSFALAITRRQVVPYPLVGAKEIESAVSRHVQAIHNGRDARAEGRTVYSLLLQPVRLISENSRLIIVPDGKLNMEPVGAAVDPKGSYLTESHILSFAPSAAAYYFLSTPRPQAPRPVEVLGVGGASYSPPPLAADIKPGFGGLFSALAPPRFSKLIRSGGEVTDLARAGGWDTRSLTGDFATESVLKRLPLSSFDILHFALHSAIDRDFPDRSGLVLTSQSGDADDDLLQAREIIGLKLNADLVTLSACDGAAGTPEGIAGTDSLVQAFLMAGARSVVASVWQADDTFTAALMRRFYARLQSGHDKAEALTLAERELLKEWGRSAAPKYWAGFRIVGDAHGTISGE